MSYTGPTNTQEGKYLVVRRDGTVPHWPYFVLGARDPIVPDVLRCYAMLGRHIRYGEEYCLSVGELAYGFERYRRCHSASDPEAASNRVDDPNVVQAMRGHICNIHVVPDLLIKQQANSKEIDAAVAAERKRCGDIIAEAMASLPTPPVGVGAGPSLWVTLQKVFDEIDRPSQRENGEWKK